MAMIEWCKEFETGFPEVDREHAELFATLNDAVGSLGESPPKERVRTALEEIRAQIADHFAHEEALMEARGYDEYEDHKADHDFLLDEIGALLNSLEADSGFVQGDAVLKRVSRWFTEHCRIRDTRLHRMLES